ncbi:MAG: NADH-quinone oxidoreductase subunit NuoN [Ottowia sp.]|nr:NADH-quinone oxidoreductase subunit NuoN [Ottowia sp.]
MPTLDYFSVLPEAFLLISICFLLLMSALRARGDGEFSYRWSLIVLFALTVWFSLQCDGTVQRTFYGMFVYDPFANLLKAGCALALFVTLVYSRAYLAARQLLRADFFALVLLSMLGQCVMISGGHFLSLYLGLELLALSSYALVALRRDAVSTEAAMKYFVLGALASGFLLYGMSMFYGATGSLDLNVVVKALSLDQANGTILVLGIVFVVAGLAFKLGVAPFHMWVPDVYQGAPSAMTLVIASAPKLAGFALLMRLLVDGFLPLAVSWQQMLIVLAVLSLVVGNIAAIAQTNFKRMLAYSTIAHMGFMLLGMTSGVVQGSTHLAVGAYGASLFYVLTYVLTTLGSFGLVLLLSRNGFEAEEIADLKGLNQRNPWFAFVSLVLMLSLAGIPPTLGFYSKLAILQAVVDAHMVWLAVLAVLTSVVGAFYYLRIIKSMYFDAPEDTHPLTPSFGVFSLFGLNGILVLGLGLFPADLIDLCTNTMRQFLAN